MYSVYRLTEREKNKITKLMWDGDTFYYFVYESQEEYDEEQKRLDKIDEEYERQMKSYLRSLS